MSAYFEPWFEFKHPLVRQLAFVVASPNLITHTPATLDIQHAFELHKDEHWIALYQQYLPRLNALDSHPQPLIDFLAQLKSTRLGLRFEYLMWFWLADSQYHHYQLLEHSLQIISGKNTLGELDFVLLNTKTQEIEHWEVALKYYLAETDLKLAHWYGLNRSDTLARKLNHFTQKQFQFEQAKQYNIQKRFAVIKGQLYIPLHHLKHQHAPLPNWVNISRRLGHWGHHIFKHDYYRLNRHEWICPNLQQSNDTALWWCNGLYRNIQTKHDYMFRQAPIVSISVCNV